MNSYWVDESKKQMHQPSTWHTLNLDQLIETKTLLLNKMQLVRGKPEYLKPLNTALARLEGLIREKTLNPHGRPAQ